MQRKTLFFFLSLTLAACQTPALQGINNLQDNKFKAKTLLSERGTLDSDDFSITYNESWLYNSPSKEPLWTAPPTFSTPGAAFEDNTYNIAIPSSSPPPIPNIAGGIVAKTVLQDTAAVSGDWIYNPSAPIKNHFTDGTPITIDQESASNVLYSEAFNSATNYKYKTGVGNTIPNSSITYTGPGWLTKGSYKYNSNPNNDLHNTSITFNITGTNVEIYGMKGPNPGWNNLKVTVTDANGNIEQATGYDSNNVIIPNLNNISTLADQNILGKILKIKALNMGLHTIKIESADASRSQGKPSFMYAFEKAIVYPSIQYTFSNNNIVYKAIKESSGGIVDISVKENNIVLDNVEKSLYSGDSPSSRIIYSKPFSNSNPKKITIEATGKITSDITNTSPRNISIDDFSRNNKLTSFFKGNKLLLQFVRFNYSGKVAVYVDGIQKSEINLSETTPTPGSEYNVLNIGGNIDTGHSFEIVNVYDDSFGAKFTHFVGFAAGQTAQIKVNVQYGGNIEFNTRKSPDKGKVKITFQNLTTPATVDYLLDLYASSTMIISPPTNFPIQAGENIITIEPDYTKHADSKGYMIDFDNIQLSATTGLNKTNLRNTIDTICTP